MTNLSKYVRDSRLQLHCTQQFSLIEVVKSSGTYEVMFPDMEISFARCRGLGSNVALILGLNSKVPLTPSRAENEKLQKRSVHQQLPTSSPGWYKVLAFSLLPLRIYQKHSTVMASSRLLDLRLSKLLGPSCPLCRWRKDHIS